MSVSTPKTDPIDPVALKTFEVALECRNFEIELFWKRSAFYWTFIAAALVAYSALPPSANVPRFAITCFGLIASIAFSLAANGSKWWQRQWEERLKMAAKAINIDLFGSSMPTKNKFFDHAWPFSVSRLTIWLTYFITVIWFVIFVIEFDTKVANGFISRHLCIPNLSTTVLSGTSVLFFFFLCTCYKKKD